MLLDRFDAVKMGYPETPEQEQEILERYGLRLDGVQVPAEVIRDIITLVRATREEPWGKELEQGVSVRGSLAIYEKAQALALLEGRSAAENGDIRRMAASSITTRVKASPDSKYYDDIAGFIDELVKDVLGDAG